jgi:lysyl-tRNA synthetase, class II
MTVFHARLRAAIPTVAAVVAGALGVVNLLSALTPNAHWRGHVLLEIEPMGVMHVFHALAVPASIALIVGAFYLRRRRHLAWQLAFGLLCGLALLDVAKGLDVEEAALSACGAGLLWWGRDEFTVRGDPARLRSAAWRVPLLVLGTLAVGVTAVAIATPEAGTGSWLEEAVRLLTWQPGTLAIGDEMRHLPLALGLLGVTALATAAWLVFRPLAAPRALPDPEVRRAVSELVRRHGHDTLAFFKLRGDQHYLFSRDGGAFLGYRVEGGVLLCAGDPVGPAVAISPLLDDAVAFAQERGLRFGAVGVSATVAPEFERLGLRRLYLGDEAIVETKRFTLAGRAIRKVRQSVSRIEKAGYTFSMETLGDVDHDTLLELERVSRAWRAGHDERGFAMALDCVGGVEQHDTVLAIARDDDGHVGGFLHFVPAYGRPAFSLSFMRRDPAAPNGMTEYLVARSLEAFRERGVDEVSLNFAAFARLLTEPQNVLERAAGRVLRWADAWFQIESLYRFNAKFDPRWEPRFVLYQGRLGLARTGVAAAWAEGQLPKPGVRRLTTQGRKT